MRGEAGEAGEALRILAAQRGEAVVGEHGQLVRGIGVEHLHAGRGERHQVHVDAELVHLLEAGVLGIEQAVEERIGVVARLARFDVVDPLDQRLVEALRGAVGDLLELGGDFGDRPGFLGGDQAHVTSSP